MTQASRIIYLPPGVMPAVSPQPPAPGGGVSGIPFDRNFFENVLTQSIDSFCKQVEGCDSPIVELFTVDGQTHYVKGISGIADTWVALHTTSPNHDHPVQVFLPYQTIYRVEIHPAEDVARRRLGFLGDGVVRQTEPEPAPAPERRPAARKK